MNLYKSCVLCPITIRFVSCVPIYRQITTLGIPLGRLPTTFHRQFASLARTKTASRLSPKTLIHHFHFFAFSLTASGGGHGGHRHRWGKPLPKWIWLLPILLSSPSSPLFRAARSTAQNPTAEPAMASAATQGNPEPREKKNVAAPPSGPWPARTSTQGWRPERARECQRRLRSTSRMAF
jgi:hypothetical protein